jgi:archaeosine-15-forming tRNA-guanine transglycosylase
VYLHLGSDILIDQNKIIAIINLETSSKLTIKNFLENIQKNKQIRYITEQGKEKSFVITTDGYFFSPISSTTLFKRSENFTDKEE